MSWNNVFISVENILKLMTLIGPLIDLVETLFNRFFPKSKSGKMKKEVVMSIGKTVLPSDVATKELSDLVDGYVASKNEKKEYSHIEFPVSNF